MSFEWTDERTNLASKLWLEGRSASWVAAELGGGLTRNAVIGKMTRLGVKRVEESARKARKRGTLAGETPKPLAPALSVKADAAIVAAPAVLPCPAGPPRRYACLGDALLEMPSGPACLWPMDIDDPDDIRFCRRPATHSSHRKVTRPVYCTLHHQRSVGAGSQSERAALRSIPSHA